MKDEISKNEHLIFLVNEIYKVGEALDIDNILYNEHCIEAILAYKLGHTLCKSTQGPDAFNGTTAIDYKTANIGTKKCKKQKNPNVKFQFHWISKNKIEEYRRYMFNCLVRDNSKFLRLYEVPYELIKPELEEAYQKGEMKRKQTGKKTGIDAHVSISEDGLIKRGATIVYFNEHNHS